MITQTKRRRSFRLNGARMHRLERTAALTNCSPAQLASEMLERQLDDEKVTHLVDLAEKARLRYLELVADPVVAELVRYNKKATVAWYFPAGWRFSPENLQRLTAMQEAIDLWKEYKLQEVIRLVCREA